MNGAIIHATIVTQDPERRIISDGGIVWKQGKIQGIGSSEEITAQAKQEGIRPFPGNGGVVFPGLINTHTHLFQQLLKGLGTDLNLETWWPTVIGPTGIQLRSHHVEAAVNGGVLEALRCGTTTVMDYMHVHPCPGLSRTVIDTALATGIRIIFARGFRDASGDPRFPPELIDNLEQVFLEVESLSREYGNRVPLFLAPAAIWATSLEGLRETVSFSKAMSIPVTMHAFETYSDELVCQTRYGKSAIDCFLEADLLSPTFLSVHSVRMDDRSIGLYRDHGVRISHNPVSNMYLASGIAPIRQFLAQGLTVSLGTDGAASNNTNNMLETMKITALLHKVHAEDPTAMTAAMVLDMATVGGARALGMEDRIGSLEEGKEADLFLFEPQASPGCCPMHDPVSSLVYSSDSRGITMTVVGGQVLMQRGEFLFLDEEKLLKQQQSMARDLVKRTDFSIWQT